MSTSNIIELIMAVIMFAGSLFALLAGQPFGAAIAVVLALFAGGVCLDMTVALAGSIALAVAVAIHTITKTKESEVSLSNYRPLSVILRILLAVALYFFLCKYKVLPEALVFVPEFVEQRFF